MAKVHLQLGAELETLTKGELDDSLSRAHDWQREAAFGLRHQDLPRMYGTVSGAAINLGADQAEGQYCGPKEGWYWAVSRVSVDGLATGDSVKLYKDTRFVCSIGVATGFATFGIRELVLKPGDFLRVTGTGLNATGQIVVTGECVSVPGPLMWKVLS